MLSSRWIDHYQNILITGPTGCSKTYLCPGESGCRHGLSVRYFRTSRLLESLNIAHGDGRFAKLIQQLAKTDLLVLDDWELEKMTLSQRWNDLLEIMEDHHGQRSTLITSQLSIGQWQKGRYEDACIEHQVLHCYSLDVVHNRFEAEGAGTTCGRSASSAFYCHGSVNHVVPKLRSTPEYDQNPQHRLYPRTAHLELVGFFVRYGDTADRKLPFRKWRTG